MAPELRGARVLLRPVVEADLPRLFTILRDPAIASHWSEPDDDFDRGELLGGDAPDSEGSSTPWVIEVHREIVGWIQCYEHPHRDYRHAGIDLFVAAAHQGRGYGSEAIRLVCRHLFDDLGHHRIVIDPAADNVRAIHTYEKVGFKRVGVMRQYERGSDGTYHDGVLLDLLREDLVGDEPTAGA